MKSHNWNSYKNSLFISWVSIKFEAPMLNVEELKFWFSERDQFAFKKRKC